MKSFLLVFIGYVFLILNVEAQGTIKGRVKSKGEEVPYANVGLIGTKIGASADENGNFNINNVPAGNYKLKISAVGYHTFTEEVILKGNEVLDVKASLVESTNNLDEVVVSGTLKPVSRLESPVSVEIYSASFLKKNPTPSVFEAMQNVNGVRPQLNCSVCNTGDIHVNGMEGPYTMVVIDGMPIVGGLSTVYGLNGIPNSLVERIEVVKGPASTLYGSEAVGGLINVITKDPENAPLFSADVYGTTWQEFNTDLSLKLKAGKASSLIGVNYYNNSVAFDKNHDNFTDITLQNRISIFNKWDFKRKDHRLASIAARYVYEDRWGGEMQWTPAFRGGDEIYGESIYTNRYELIGAYQLPIPSERVVYNVSFSDHQQNSAYGDSYYIADQKIFFNQLKWDTKVGKSHDLLLGLTYRFTYYDDNTPATENFDNELANQPSRTHLPGLFVQDEVELSKKSKLLLGLRYDYNTDHGSILTPRLNFKWSPTDNGVFRLGLGNGYRVVNLFTEDHAATTGAREVVIAEELKPEQSYNANLNYLRYFYPKFGLLTFDGSLFYTHFTNKIIPDYETNDNQIIYDNLNGNATSRGVTLNMEASFLNGLRARVGATLMDVFQIEINENGEEEKLRQLLTEQYSGVFSMSYTFVKPQITIDYTGNVYGPMKLPLLENDFRDEFSKIFSIQNIQVTKLVKSGFEIYGGVKNLLNFTPPSNSIMRAFDPFDKTADDPITNPNGYTFDPTYVFAANQGIRGYAGLRYTFGGK